MRRGGCRRAFARAGSTGRVLSETAGAGYPRLIAAIERWGYQHRRVRDEIPASPYAVKP